MNNQQITVVYKWTAKPGKAEELQAIYREVSKQMQENEPNALKVECFFDESSNDLVVVDVFKDEAIHQFTRQQVSITSGTHHDAA